MGLVSTNYYGYNVFHHRSFEQVKGGNLTSTLNIKAEFNIIFFHNILKVLFINGIWHPVHGTQKTHKDVVPHLDFSWCNKNDSSMTRCPQKGLDASIHRVFGKMFRSLPWSLAAEQWINRQNVTTAAHLHSSFPGIVSMVSTGVGHFTSLSGHYDKGWNTIMKGGLICSQFLLWGL